MQQNSSNILVFFLSYVEILPLRIFLMYIFVYEVHKEVYGYYGEY